MTLQREEPGVWAATCDACGDRLVLDVDGDAGEEEAAEELDERGWSARPVQVGRFDRDFSGDGRLKVEYREHDCPDCA